MIRYSLQCDHGHRFESWFASATAYDRLRAAGHVLCAHCGSAAVDKALMAPAVAQTTAGAGSGAGAVPPAEPVQTPAMSDKLIALRRAVEANSDYVGNRFVTEARAIHLGDAPERAIWGEARIDEVRALVDEGVPVAPLPFIARNKTN